MDSKIAKVSTKLFPGQNETVVYPVVAKGPERVTMLKTSACAVLAAATTFILSCFTAQAQDSSPCIVGISAMISGPSPKGPLFSAVVKVTFDQKFGEGNSIHGTVRPYSPRLLW